MASGESAKNFFKCQTLKEPKLVQLDQVLHKWFTAMCSEGKPMIGPMIIEKTKLFYDQIRIADLCTISEGSNRKTTCRNFGQCRYRLIIQNI
jgi:hypothetical protein